MKFNIKYYSQFLLNYQIIMILFNLFYLISAYSTLSLLEPSSDKYFRSIFIFSIGCILFAGSAMTFIFSVLNGFLTSIISDNIKFNIIILGVLTGLFCYLYSEHSFVLIGVCVLGAFNFINFFTTYETYKKKERIKIKGFHFIKSLFKGSEIRDEFFFSGKNKDIHYSDNYVFFYGKILSMNDVKILEEAFGKKIEDLDENERLTVEMYTIK